MTLARQQQRRDTASTWASVNPVLLDGEIGVDTDADRIKVGDGVTAWVDLPYADRAEETEDAAARAEAARDAIAEALSITSLTTVGNALSTSSDVNHIFLGSMVKAESPSPVSGKVTQYRTRFDTVLSGRKVRFSIQRPNGGDSFTSVWESPEVDASASGLLTYVPPTPPQIAVGDVLGAWTDAQNQADGVRTADSGGPTIGRLYWQYASPPENARLLAGTTRTTWNGGTAVLLYNLNLEATVESVGELPIVIGGAAPSWLKNKTLGAVGTSITGGTAASPLSNGYIGQQASLLGCTVDNQGVGSSGIVWNGTRALSLGATRAQLTAAGFDPDQSYETKVLGRTFDLLILDHHYNDRDQAIGTLADTTTATFYGAYNVVIAAKLAETPTQQFAFLTPFSAYAPTYESEGAENPQVLAVRTAVLALARKWGIPVLDWTFTLGINEVTDDLFQPDTVHPRQDRHDLAARRLRSWLNTL